MIKKIYLQNFKCFLELEKSLSQLTILTGINSAGKSSILQALRIIPRLGDEIANILPGHGSWNDLECKQSETGIIKLEVYDEDEKCIKSSYDINASTQEITRASGFTSIWRSVANIHYIGAARLGPQTYLPTQPGMNGRTVGDQGEHVVEFCKLNAERIVHSELRHPRATGNTFDVQLEAWMGEVSPGVRFQFEVNTQTDTSWLTVGSSLDVNVHRRPVNVGFGVSYSLPIVATLLAAPPGSTILLENPEAHLHPKGQTRMGELIAYAAMSDVQVIVETHSDHLLDGIRISAKEKRISTDKVTIYYFSKDAQDMTQVKAPKLQENGDLSDWPEGFFDQSLINLSKLAEF